VRRVGLGGSWLRGLKRQACCCFWRDARRPLGIKLDHEISKDRATPAPRNIYILQWLMPVSRKPRSAGGTSFSARRQDLPFALRIGGA
jgi:hypothetical protein